MDSYEVNRRGRKTHPNAAWFEVKAVKEGITIFKSTSRGQIGAHIDNLVRNHPRAARAGAASLSLVTTDEVNVSIGLRIKAKINNVKLNHFYSQYKMVNGVMNIKFRNSIWNHLHFL